MSDVITLIKIEYDRLLQPHASLFLASPFCGSISAVAYGKSWLLDSRVVNLGWAHRIGPPRHVNGTGWVHVLAIHLKAD